MLGTNHIAHQTAHHNSTAYATSTDFCRIFESDMNRLYLLAFLLTTDHASAEKCFVSGLEDSKTGSVVFKDWAQSWARRTIIASAIRMIHPRPQLATENHQPANGTGLGEHAGPVHVAVATHMGTEALAERGVEARPPLADGVQSPDFLGLGLALDRLFPLEARVSEPFNETSCGVADHGAARPRQALKTRGKIDGVTHGGESGGFPLDWRHHGDSRTDAGAHHRTLAELGLHLVSRCRKSRVDCQGRAAGSERGVFLRLGDAEHGHDAVAGEAAHRAAVFANGPRQFFVDYSDETEGSLLANSLRNRRVSDHVREKYRDLTPFAQIRRCTRGSTFCIFHGGNDLTRASASASSEHSGPFAESWSHLMIDGCSPYEPMRQIFATAC